MSKPCSTNILLDEYMRHTYYHRDEIASLKEELAKNSARTMIQQKTKAELMQETLLHAFPDAFDDNIIDEIKQNENYPRLAYWKKNSFNPNLVPNDGDVFPKKFRFMEDEDGNHIT